jgi:hypothetical protein
MSQPHTGAGSNPAHFGQSRTLFVEEGNPVCLLVIRQGEKMSQKFRKFASSLAAFEWCQKGGSGMVYYPAGAAPDLGRN